MTLNIIILAAGEGKRMYSSTPKVLHKIAGKTLLERVVDTATQLESQQIWVVCGHGKENVQKTLAKLPVTWVEQPQQLGTGHAVNQALPFIEDNGLALVLYGDVPLISVKTLQRLLQQTPVDGVGLLVADVADPTGLGRIITDNQGHVLAIVEEKDATIEQKVIKEIFTGILAAPVKQLRNWLTKVKNKNAQGEYYLPDITLFALLEGAPVVPVKATCPIEIQGVNDQKQLALLERFYQQKMADELMIAGVHISDPLRIDIRGNVIVGKDVHIDINVILDGDNTIGKGCHIAANNVIRNTNIGNNVIIKENSVIEDAVIEEGAVIGPFARIRPGTHIKRNAHVGNFVEVKKSIIGENSKANHLSYLGDCEVGNNVNIGAGTITCNYDGVYKHKTIIEDDCFIGSGTELVAPVTIAKGGTIGAGSTITCNTEPDRLTISRSLQKTVPNWQRPRKEENR